MTVVVLGGHDRFKNQLEQYSKKIGVKLKFINKWCPYAFHTLNSADYIIVITGCVSHELVNLAKIIDKTKCIFCHKKGLCEIKKIIDEIKNSNKISIPIENEMQNKLQEGRCLERETK
ncbi:hypothetical protein TOPB45_1178 [Thermodesulfobacterium geofontis OPF15]|jgi:hypothetical protein|uniref:DUF2325 domain-containing protein n=1 Tax=Thermodesulfobacterium geofontis (strain OPF15) TaxID=795359 RepID=F8C1U3_THEGP|nr:DUF2325 domain-containing protein [Thermodesulfobacterium geofontis]AEH23266.1 hypothetical protein TOPB45_1178 [Thermodesulfobacterium geofontis OPF15]